MPDPKPTADICIIVLAAGHRLIRGADQVVGSNDIMSMLG